MLLLKDSYIYQNKKPYPYMYMDNILDETFAYELQKEILDIPDSEFDRYDNPFEQKCTLRDKNKYTKKLQELMDYLISDEFIKQLSIFTGYELFVDEFKHYYGVHKYNNGDKLDIHLDAGIHPKNGLKKQITLGIYLSLNWKKEYGCELEIWQGNKNSIEKCIDCIEPKFNRLVIFTCTDVSWHGNPNPVKCNVEDASRIFITLSYLSNEMANFTNKNKRAFFVGKPDEIHDAKLDKLRSLRSDNEECEKTYRVT